MTLAKTLMLAGAALFVVGTLLYLVPALGALGRLPGDLRIERPGLRIYLPITTCIMLSIALSGLLWLIARLR